jgi:glycolate oxidase FAD binding subunit
MPDATSSSLSGLADRIRAAAAARAPLRIRGGGSKDFYGAGAPAGHWPGDILDTRGHAGIVSYEPSELVVTARCGTPLAELEAALAEKGQCLAFEPPHFRGAPFAASTAQATVGGMVAAGLAGPARACVGGVRDYVLGVHTLNGRAEHLQFGGQVMKNVAGYDVSRLMAGSLGVLGLITEVSLKVLPQAPAEATLRFFIDEASAIQQLNTWAGQPLPLNASSWVMDAGQPTLYLRLRGALAAVNAACQRLQSEAGGVRVDSPQTSADWSAARDLRLPWFNEGFARGQCLWRISVPQTTPPLNLGNTLIDWLGGQRWVWSAAADSQAAQHIQSVAGKCGGNATIFIANTVENTPATGQFDIKNGPLKRIHEQLKKEFDPAGIFNPGRLVAGL